VCENLYISPNRVLWGALLAGFWQTILVGEFFMRYSIVG
jgi:hypothetical protein